MSKQYMINLALQKVGQMYPLIQSMKMVVGLQRKVGIHNDNKF